MENKIEARIGNATRVIGRMNNIVLRMKELSQSTKMKVVNATVMPVLVYGCETGSLTKKQQSEVQATQMGVIRRIEVVNRLDRVRNVDIRERLNQGVLDLVKRRRESWKGRLEEMNIEKTTKNVFCGEMEGKSANGVFVLVGNRKAPPVQVAEGTSRSGMQQPNAACTRA